MYTCPVCKSNDPDYYLRCQYAGCLDGRDQERNRKMKDHRISERVNRKPRARWYDSEWVKAPLEAIVLFAAFYASLHLFYWIAR